MRKFFLAALLAMGLVVSMAISVGADGIPHCC